MTKRKLRTLDEVEYEYFKKHPKELKSYLEVAFEEYQKDGNEKAFLAALGIAAKAHGGFQKLARESGLNRENLYRALSARRDPRFSTILSVINHLGFELKIA